MKRVAQFIEFLVKKFIQLPLVDKWLNEHPKIHHQLNERLSFEKFTGIAFTILVIIFLYFISLFLGIVQDYLSHNSLVLADERIANLLYFFRNINLLYFFYFITLFAESTVVIILSIILSISLWVRRQRIYIFSLWLVLILGEGLAFWAKYVFQRERPALFMRTITENSFSFPSGHATAVVLFYGFLLYLVIRNYSSLKTKITSFIAFLLLVVLVDFSRLYLGVHYLSDVIAGNLLGFSVLILCIILTEWIISYKPKLIPNKIKSSQIFLLLIIAVASVFLVYGLTDSPVSKDKSMTAQEIKTEEVLSLFDKNILPRFTETLTGANQEPINLIIISPEACFEKDINNANWTSADKPTISSTKLLAKKAALNQAYSAAPMTPSFYDAKPNDFGFEKQTEKNTARSRHHARFWKTDYVTSSGTLYLGTTSLDVGIKWFLFAHSIAPDIDTERDLFVSDLKQTGVITKDLLVQFVIPTLGENFSGDNFFTNGKAVFMTFSDCTKNKQ